MSGWRTLLLLPAFAALWVLASLYLRVDLPGASELAWAVFSAVVSPLRGLDLPGPGGLLAAGVAVPALALLARHFAAVRLGLDLSLALVALAPLAVVVALGLLMERPAAMGTVVALVLAVRSQIHEAGSDHHPSTQGRLVVLSLVGASVVAATYYVLLLARAEPGYPVLQWAGRLFRHGIITPGFAFGAAALVALVCLVTVLASRPGGLARVGGSSGGAIVVGLVVSLVLRPGFADQSARWPSLLSISVAVLLVPVLGPYCRPTPSSWPLLRGGLHLALVPVLCASLLVVQAYCTRILHCPSFEAGGPLTRLAVLPEVFRVALDGEGKKAVLSIRGSGHLASMVLSPEVGAPELVDPGPARCHPLADQSPSELIGPPEELLFVPGADRFFAVVVTPSLDEGGQFLTDSIPTTHSCSNPDDFGSLLVRLSEDASRVERAYTLPGLCWVSSVEWDERDQLLLLGWEYRAGLHRHDLLTGWSEGYVLDHRVGDVAGLALDPSADRDRLFSVSLWTGSFLTRLARADLRAGSGTVPSEEEVEHAEDAAEQARNEADQRAAQAHQRYDEIDGKAVPLRHRAAQARERVIRLKLGLSQVDVERAGAAAERMRLERELSQAMGARKVADSYVEAISANLESAADDVRRAEVVVQDALERQADSEFPRVGMVSSEPRSDRRLATRGVNYDVELDSQRHRLYISSYYSSNVQVVDAESLTLVGTIPTGLGTRALQIVPERDLLLISSIYDGTVRVWDLAEETLLAALPVGGHVKSFAVSPGGDIAYFWSQCGLLSLDLGALQRDGGGT